MKQGERWVPLSLRFLDDPRVIEAGPAAAFVFLRGLFLAQEVASRGLLTERELRGLCPRGKSTLWRRLVDSDLLRPVEDRWALTGWLDWHPQDRPGGLSDAAVNTTNVAKSATNVAKVSIETACSFLERDTREIVHSCEFPVNDIRADFEQAWPAYPRKVAKQRALRAYVARRRAGASADDLATATRHYADHCRREGTAERFIMHGSTFYGPDEPWRDHLAPPKPPKVIERTPRVIER